MPLLFNFKIQGLVNLVLKLTVIILLLSYLLFSSVLALDLGHKMLYNGIWISHFALRYREIDIRLTLHLKSSMVPASEVSVNSASIFSIVEISRYTLRLLEGRIARAFPLRSLLARLLNRTSSCLAMRLGRSHSQLVLNHVHSAMNLHNLPVESFFHLLQISHQGYRKAFGIILVPHTHYRLGMN